MWIRKAFLLAFISVTLLVNASEKNVTIGILEDVPGHYAGETNTRAVRVVFEKNGSEWRAFPCDCPDLAALKAAVSKYPAELDWTVIFNGRSLGRLKSRARNIEFYADIGLQEIVSPASIPAIWNRSEKYSTWVADSLYRPLIAVSQPNFSDPELWKTAQISSQILMSMHRLFRQKFPKLCKMKQDETLEPFNYLDKDIKLRKAYASKKDWILAEFNLQGAIDCEYEVPLAGKDCWFVADPQKGVRYLDIEGWLVDAGDYDRDGKSELVFQIGGYNRGGYVLYYDDFKKRAVFEFSYH